MAEADLAEARAWYDHQRAGLGDEFLDDAEATIRNIPLSALAHPIIHRSTRRRRLKRFPYAAYYRVTRDALIVLGVLHVRRNPTIWMKRK